jgi:hypothetical protein
VSSNPIHGEVYSIQHYVIKFVSDLRQVGGFLRFPPPIKLTKQPILVHFTLCFQYMSFCVFVAYQHQVRLFSATSKQEVKNMLFIELMTGCYLLCSRTTCWGCIFVIELAYWNKSQQVDMLFHSDTMSWFQAYQSLLLLPNTNLKALWRCSIHKFHSIWIDPMGVKHIIFHTWEKHMLIIHHNVRWNTVVR